MERFLLDASWWIAQPGILSTPEQNHLPRGGITHNELGHPKAISEGGIFFTEVLSSEMTLAVSS